MLELLEGRLTLLLELPLLDGRAVALLLVLLGRLTLVLELPLAEGRALLLGRVLLVLTLLVADGALLLLELVELMLPALPFGLTVAPGATLLLLFAGAGGIVPSLKWLAG